MKNKFDIIVIGGGPAGISAGIYTHRAGADVLVIDNGKSALKQAKKIDNYYGVLGLSGTELVNKGVTQYTNLGGLFVSEEVLKIVQDFNTHTFKIKTIKCDYECKIIILALGLAKKKKIKEFEPFEGKNLSFCAICDGFFYKDKVVAVVGEGDFAKTEVDELINIVDKVYLITGENKTTLSKEKVEVVNKKIKEVVGEDLIQKIVFDDNSSIFVDGVFIANGNLSSFEIAKQLGILTKNEFIIVDKNFMTNIPAIFACGDMIGGLLQVSKAVSDGAQAGIEAVRFLKFMENED